MRFAYVAFVLLHKVFVNQIFVFLSAIKNIRFEKYSFSYMYSISVIRFFLRIHFANEYFSKNEYFLGQTNKKKSMSPHLLLIRSILLLYISWSFSLLYRFHFFIPLYLPLPRSYHLSLSPAVPYSLPLRNRYESLALDLSRSVSKSLAPSLSAHLSVP